MFKAIAPVKLPKIIKYAIFLIPFIEIALFIVVGMAIGVLATIGLVVATTLLGLWVLKNQGMAAMLGQQSAPKMKGPMDMMDMSVGMMAGVLLLLPGFLTDCLGLICLFPPVKRKIAGLYLKQSLGAFHKAAQANTNQSTQYSQSQASNDPKVIEGEFWHDDDKKS